MIHAYCHAVGLRTAMSNGFVHRMPVILLHTDSKEGRRGDCAPKEERVREISPLSHAEVSEDVSRYTRNPERPLKHRLLLIVDVTRPPVICQQDMEKAVFRGCLLVQAQRRSSCEIRFTRVASGAGRFLQHSGMGSCAASRVRTTKRAGVAEDVHRAGVWRPQQ